MIYINLLVVYLYQVQEQLDLIQLQVLNLEMEHMEMN